MAPPAVTIYVTSLTSQPKVRQHIDLLHRSLKGLEIPYETFDLVNEPEAKTRWQRAKPPGMVVGLPGYLVDGEWVGTMDDFEYAVESQTLPQFLKQDQDTHVDPSTSADQSGTAAGCGGSGSTTVGQGELERLMREMSEADLDKLAGELGVGLDSGDVKVGLMVPEGAEPADATSPGGNSALDGGAAGPGLASEGVGAEKEEKAGTGGGDLENIGLKGTGEVIRDPDLELKERLERVSLAAAGAGEEAGMPGSSLVGQLEQIAAGVEKSGGKEKVD